MNLDFINKLFNKIGVNIPWLSDPINFDFSGINPLVGLSSVFFVFSGLILLGVINILLYLIALYVVDHPSVYNKLLSIVSPWDKNKYFEDKLIKAINLYKHMRFFYILIDFVFILVSLYYIMYICYIVITNYQ